MMAATGLRQRHGLNCSGGRCGCSWEASVYSVKDEKKVRKAFPTRAAAVAWRRDSLSAVQQGRMRAPTGETLRQASAAWLGGREQG